MDNDGGSRRGEQRPMDCSDDESQTSSDQSELVRFQSQLPSNVSTFESTFASAFPQCAGDICIASSLAAPAEIFQDYSSEITSVELPQTAGFESLRSRLQPQQLCAARAENMPTSSKSGQEEAVLLRKADISQSPTSKDFCGGSIALSNEYGMETGVWSECGSGMMSTLDLHERAACFPSCTQFLKADFLGVGSVSRSLVEIIKTPPAIDIATHSMSISEPQEESELEVTSGTAEELIYPNARITVHESALSILTFGHTEKLTVSAIGRLLPLIELHCPEGNEVVKSSSKLFEFLVRIDLEYELIFYCNLCWRVRKSKNDVCDKCSDPKRKVHFYVHFPLAPQIRKMFQRKSFVEALNYRQCREKRNLDAIEDIVDGDLYKEAMKSFLSNTNNLSLQYYTDGIQAYESSSFSLWPQMFAFNELSPKNRYKPENLLLSGLWGSQEHPHPNIVLKHTAKDLLKLRAGFEVDVADTGEKREVKVCCLCGTCDSPAKASFLNMKSHAGYYSCPRCLIKGLKSEASGNVMVFPFQEDLMPRSVSVNYSTYVQESLKKHRNQAAKDEVCRGVNGPTLLSVAFFFCMFKSFAIDSMHCVYMGVVKQFLHLWFDSKYHNESFSLSTKVDEVNNLLSNIRLPHFVQRLPVDIDKLSFWKASLCLNFFFHFMLPVLKVVMKEIYFAHLLLLVEGVSLLNSDSVTACDIDRATNLLFKFVEETQTHYNVRNMSLNVHLLCHLPQSVKTVGPLWATSCFPWEDLNGKLISLFHGTTDCLLQITDKFPIFTGLSSYVENMAPSAAKDLCEHLLFKWKRLHVQDRINSKSFVVGFYDKTVLYYQEISELLYDFFDIVPTFCTFPKVYINRELYVASSYTRSVRKSSFVKYCTAEGVFFGDILTFVKVNNVTIRYFAYIQRCFVEPFVAGDQNMVTHLHRIVGVSGLDLISIECLIDVCFYISVQDNNYVSEPLNRLEKF